VQGLQIGDEVQTLAGRKTIKWIGYNKFTKEEGRTWQDIVMPVRVTLLQAQGINSRGTAGYRVAMGRTARIGHSVRNRFSAGLTPPTTVALRDPSPAQGLAIAERLQLDR
jgi:hypothetical protein